VIATHERLIPIAQPLIGDEEKQAVLEVLESGQLAQGAKVRELEAGFARYCGVKHAVATSNGTTALHVAVMARGIGAGDEIITSPFTFIASANVALFVGARPVFVDIEPDTFNLDPNQVEERITPRTRAVMPVHLFGQPADMDALTDICRRHNLWLIEDACQAHGAEWRGQRVGSFGVGCFSFYPTKNMTTAEGGIITTDDDDVAARARLLREHGAPRRYHHEVLGYNFRLTDLHAALGVAQLGKLDGWTARRIANAARLTAGITTVTTPLARPEARHVYHQYTVRVARDRDAAQERLRQRGIGTGVHYPVPAHHQPLYRQLGYTDRLPIAEQAAREVLSLPVHPALTEDDLGRIITEVNAL
jgi:dTDP-4-amino-4,6-dideoxygalactose transaminase